MYSSVLSWTFTRKAVKNWKLILRQSRVSPTTFLLAKENTLSIYITKVYTKIFTIKQTNTIKWGNIEQPHQGNTEQSCPFHGNSLNSVYNRTAISQDVCVLDWSLKVSAPQTQQFWNVLTTFDLLFSPKWQFSNERIWCLETNFWLKAISSEHVQEYAETSVFDLCMLQIVINNREIWLSFF